MAAWHAQGHLACHCRDPWIWNQNLFLSLGILVFHLYFLLPWLTPFSFPFSGGWPSLFHLLFLPAVYLPQYRSQSLLYRLLPISVQTHYPLKLFPLPYSHIDTHFHCWTFSQFIFFHPLRTHGDLVLPSTNVLSYLSLLKSSPQQFLQRSWRKNPKEF